MGIKRKLGRFYLDTKPDNQGYLPLMFEFTYGGMVYFGGQFPAESSFLPYLRRFPGIFDQQSSTRNIAQK